jgi:division protein CdvB (Snf7/Vps24/ESCRT-III family)
MAEKGQHGPAKILSKDIARQRQQKNQYLMMGSQLKAMEMQMASSAMNETIMTALSGSTQVMQNVNENMDVAGVRNTLMEFNKQMGKAEMNQEIMGDAMDMMDGNEVGADADDVYNGILGEIGLQGMSQVGNNVGTGVI